MTMSKGFLSSDKTFCYKGYGGIQRSLALLQTREKALNVIVSRKAEFSCIEHDNILVVLTFFDIQFNVQHL